MTTKAGTPERLAYSVAEAAQALGLSKALIWDRIWDRTIPHVRVGRRVLIPRRALERLLDAADTPTRPNG